MDQLAREPNSVVISVNMGLNLDYLLEVIWEKLDIVRVYTKKVFFYNYLKKGSHPDFEEPIILTKNRKGCTIKAVCLSVHKVLLVFNFRIF